MQSLLANSAETLRCFVSLLSQEQAALRAGNAEPLSEIAQQKAALIETLNQAETLRHRLLAQQGFTADNDGMHRWLLSRPSGEGKALTSLWQEILRLASEAKSLNQLNGQLVSLRLQATSEALSALNVRARESGLYGPAGQSASLTGSRIIDSA